MKIAVIRGRGSCTLVRWRPELQQARGRALTISVHERGISIAMVRGRDLDRGLSR
jgi:hypothetical protein